MYEFERRIGWAKPAEDGEEVEVVAPAGRGLQQTSENVLVGLQQKLSHVITNSNPHLLTVISAVRRIRSVVYASPHVMAFN